MIDVFQFIGAGGDVAMIGLFVVWWRLDRRLVRIETYLFNGKKK